MCTIHDGSVFERPSVESIVEINRDFAQIGREMGIGIAFKQWLAISHIIEDSGMHASVRTPLAGGRALAR